MLRVNVTDWLRLTEDDHTTGVIEVGLALLFVISVVPEATRDRAHCPPSDGGFSSNSGP